MPADSLEQEKKNENADEQLLYTLEMQFGDIPPQRTYVLYGLNNFKNSVGLLPFMMDSNPRINSRIS